MRTLSKSAMDLRDKKRPTTVSHGFKGPFAARTGSSASTRLGVARATLAAARNVRSRVRDLVPMNRDLLSGIDLGGAERELGRAFGRVEVDRATDAGDDVAQRLVGAVAHTHGGLNRRSRATRRSRARLVARHRP